MLGEVLHQPEQVGAGAGDRPAHVVLAQPLELPEHRVTSGLEVLDQGVLGIRHALDPSPRSSSLSRRRNRPCHGRRACRDAGTDLATRRRACRDAGTDPATRTASGRRDQVGSSRQARRTSRAGRLDSPPPAPDPTVVELVETPEPTPPRERRQVGETRSGRLDKLDERPGRGASTRTARSRPHGRRACRDAGTDPATRAAPGRRDQVGSSRQARRTSRAGRLDTVAPPAPDPTVVEPVETPRTDPATQAAPGRRDQAGSSRQARRTSRAGRLDTLAHRPLPTPRSSSLSRRRNRPRHASGARSARPGRVVSTGSTNVQGGAPRQARTNVVRSSPPPCPARP